MFNFVSNCSSLKQIEISHWYVSFRARLHYLTECLQNVEHLSIAYLWVGILLACATTLHHISEVISPCIHATMFNALLSLMSMHKGLADLETVLATLVIVMLNGSALLPEAKR